MNHDLVQVIPRAAGFTAICQCGARYTAPYKRDVTDWHANHKSDKAAEALQCPNGCDLGYADPHSADVLSRAVHIHVGRYSGGPHLLRCPDCKLAWIPPLPDLLVMEIVPYLHVANAGIAS